MNRPILTFCSLVAVASGCIESTPETETTVEEAIEQFPLLPLYSIRLQAIATADDNGAHPSPVTAATLTALMPELNEIFASARIQIEFDPATDFETRNNTFLNQRFSVVGDLEDYTDPDVRPETSSDWHAAARRAVADDHRDKLTVFFAAPLDLAYSTSLHHWDLVPDSGGGSSSRYSRSVAWKNGVSASSLAHEMGHYLHNVHTFVGGVETVEDAADKIAAYLDDGHPVADGLDALDGDRKWVLDTPADAAGSIFVEEYGDKCGPDGSIPIPVTYGNNLHHTFTLAPDRTLAMSYFKDCPFDMKFSPDQKQRMLDAATLMNRRSVLNYVPAPATSTTPILSLLGTESAGAINDVKATRVGVNRVVTATTGSTSSLKLIVWDVGAGANDGEITRRGEITVGDVSGSFAVTHGGLRQVLVAYRDTGGGLTIKSYAIDSRGNLTLEHTETAGGITDVAIVHIDQITFVTAVRLSTGVLRTIVWRIYADGEMARLGHGDGGTIDGIEGLTAFSPASLGDEDVDGAVTVFTRTSGNLNVQTWKINGDWSVVLADTEAAGAITSAAVSDVDFDLAATVVQSTSNVQKVIAWKTNYFGFITRGDSYTVGSCSRTASAAIGTRYLATACKRPSDGAQIVRLYEISIAGSSVTLKHEQNVGTAVELAMTAVGSNKVMIATRSSSNALYVRTLAVAP